MEDVLASGPDFAVSVCNDRLPISKDIGNREDQTRNVLNQQEIVNMDYFKKAVLLNGL